MTGLYPHSRSIPGIEWRMSPAEQTIADLFNENGYQTAYFGKWHLYGGHGVLPGMTARKANLTPVPREFQGRWKYWRGFELANKPFETYCFADDDPTPICIEGYQTDGLTDLFCEFLDREGASHSRRPFAAVLSVEPPHPPLQAPKSFLRATMNRDITPYPGFCISCQDPVPGHKYNVLPEDEIFTRMRMYYAMIENLDCNIGRLFDALRRNNMEDNTIIVFTADHGQMDGYHGFSSSEKSHPYEQSVGVPLIVSHPDLPDGSRGSVLPQPVSTIDLAATLLGLADIESPVEWDGTDLSPLILGGRTGLNRGGVLLEFVHDLREWHPYFHHSWRAVRTETHKYTVIGDAYGSRPWQLFDLSNDPYELNNLLCRNSTEESAVHLHKYLREMLAEARDHFAGARWSISVPARVSTFEIRVDLLHRPGIGSFNRAISTADSFQSTADRIGLYWNSYMYENVPIISCPDKRVQKLNRYLAWVFESNAVCQGGILPHAYSIPKHTFWAWFMWDTSKSAISGAWYNDRSLSWGGLLNSENQQYPEPHWDHGVITNSAMFYGSDCWASSDPTAKRYRSMPNAILDDHDSGTHPPLFSRAIHLLWQNDKRDDLMLRLLPVAKRYDEYFDRTRSSKRFPGLIFARRWSDTGMDNSPRWGQHGSEATLGHEHYPESDWRMPVVSVDLNVYTILEKRKLAEMCRYTGDDLYADELESVASERERALFDYLWNEETDLFHDREETRGTFIPVIAPTGLTPLQLHALPQARVEALVDWLFNEDHFWSDAPLPSVSMQNPHFEGSRSYWRGPVWMSYTIDVLRGLCLHAPLAAHKLLDRLLEMMLPNGQPAIYENYNPVTGQPQDTANFSWNGQLIDVIMSDMLGISAHEGSIEVTAPAVPAEWDEWSVRNLRLGRDRYSIAGIRAAGEWRISIDLENA